MTQKKITIKEVAKEAGVSVATVSYVMNHRTDIKLKESTRQKVLQVANLLNYTPNLAARALATSQQHLLGVTYEKSSNPMKKAQQMVFLETFLGFFRQKGYKVILIDSDSTEQYDQVDAVICYDVTSEHFHSLGNQNFVPMIAYDSYINDDLFFQINTDYDRLKREADAFFQGEEYTYLLLEPSNRELYNALQQKFQSVTFFTSEGEGLLQSGKPLLITDPILGNLLGERPNTYVASSLFEEKLELLNTAIEHAMHRDDVEHHSLTI